MERFGTLVSSIENDFEFIGQRNFEWKNSEDSYLFDESCESSSSEEETPPQGQTNSAEENEPTTFANTEYFDIEQFTYWQKFFVHMDDVPLYKGCKVTLAQMWLMLSTLMVVCSLTQVS
jgi:hypothetical protein